MLQIGVTVIDVTLTGVTVISVIVTGVQVTEVTVIGAQSKMLQSQVFKSRASCNHQDRKLPGVLQCITDGFQK